MIFPDPYPSPDPAKSFLSDRIRIHSTAASGLDSIGVSGSSSGFFFSGFQIPLQKVNVRKRKKIRNFIFEKLDGGHESDPGCWNTSMKSSGEKKFRTIH
jgi:hypothetical protein